MGYNTSTEKVVRRGFNAIAVGGVFIAWLIALCWFSSLPASIPTHFDIVGRPDRFGPKVEVWFLPAIVTALAIASLLIQREKPEDFDFPGRLKQADKPRIFSYARIFISMLGACSASIFVIIEWRLLRAGGVAPGPQSLQAVWVVR